jgi:serine/threonine protein kinase
MNILLSHNGLWITDFGTSTDFSAFEESATQGGERGTPKYFAPEVAAFEPNGRSADIFSLGCIFLEMVALRNGRSLGLLKRLRPLKDCSFQANLSSIYKWFDSITFLDAVDQYLMGEVRMMLRFHPRSRPTASQVEKHLKLIESFGRGSYSMPLQGPCCKTVPTLTILGSGANQNIGRLDITIGNTYEYVSDDLHKWSFFVWPSDPDVVDRVHCFLVSVSSPKWVLPPHPLKLSSSPSSCTVP